MFRLFCIRLGQILLCPVLNGCGDLPVFHVLPGVLTDLIGNQLVCLILDLRCLGGDDARCRVVDFDSFIVDDFRSLIRDHLRLIGQRFFCLDRDILRFHHDGIDALFEGRAFSISIFHRGADLFSRHIQRACGGSIARRSLHAFSCFDGEVSGVVTILIRYAKLIRIDAARGDVVARDVGIRRSARCRAVCGRVSLSKGCALSVFRSHGGVIRGVGDLAIFDLAIRCCTHGIGDAGRSGHAGILAHLVGQRLVRFVGNVLRRVRNIAGHVRGLVSSNGMLFIARHGCLETTLVLFRGLASDGSLLVSSHSRFLTAFVVLRHLAFHIFGLGASDFVQLIAADGGGQIFAYGIRHIAGGIVYDILCLVCDGTILRGIGDIEVILLCRGLTVFALDGFIISLCRIDGTIGILAIFVFQVSFVFARSLGSRAGVAILVCDDIFGLCLRLCAVVRVVPILHIIHDDIRGLLMEALIARCTIGKAYFVLFCIEGGRAGNRLSCPIDYKILRGYFPMIDFGVVIGRFVSENHLIRGDSAGDFQIAINRGVFQIGRAFDRDIFLKCRILLRGQFTA